MLKLEKVFHYDESDILEALSDGIAVAEALLRMEPNCFKKESIVLDEEDAY